MIRLYILSLLIKIINQNNVNIINYLYRDDSFVLLKNQSEQQTNRIRRTIINTFKEIDLTMEITTNRNAVDFIDNFYTFINLFYCIFS